MKINWPWRKKVGSVFAYFDEVYVKPGEWNGIGIRYNAERNETVIYAFQPSWWQTWRAKLRSLLR